MPKFYIPTLINFQGIGFREKLESTLKENDENKLFLFLDNSLRKRAKERKIAQNLVDDTVQDGVLNVLLVMRDFKENGQDEEWLYDKIENIYTDLKPAKEAYTYSPFITSLDKNVGKKEKPLVDSMTKRNKIIPLSSANDEERNKQKQKVQIALSNVDLTEREQKMLGERYSQDNLLPYKNIGEENNISCIHAYNILKGTLLKIQISNNSLNPETKRFIDDFSLEFKIEPEITENIIIKYPQIVNQGIEKTKEKVYGLVEKFEDNGLTLDDYIKASIKQPSLFYRLPDAIENNIRGTVERFKNNGLTLEDYIKASIKQPSLFCQSPDTIEKNVKDLVKKFEDDGLSLDSYLKACVKQPQLFHQSPNTIEKNVRDLVKKFENNGLTLENYLKACIKRPRLFCQSPETIEKNVRGLVEKFENDGLTLEGYLKACVRQPQLFCQSPDTIEKNVRGLVDRFKDNDLTLKDYLRACTNQPQLFSLAPDTPEKNVKELVKKFKNEGLTLDNYLHTCMKQPSLFFQSPETIAEHIDMLKFARMNSESDINKKNLFEKILSRPFDLSNSSSLILIRHLIIPQMFKNSKIPKGLRKNKLRENLNDYLRENPKAHFSLNIRPIETNTDCLKTLDETLKKIEQDVNRENIFEINVIR